VAFIASVCILRADTPLRVGRITIIAKPVFDAGETGGGGFYRAVNLLHVQTPAALLRRFLLFKEGDPFDASKLAETERNFRQFDFLKSVSVIASPPHDGLVDVTVMTEDEWTTDVNGDFSNDGGRDTYSANVSQKDLFGSGSALDLLLDHGLERNTAAVAFFDPSALGPYWNLNALFAKSSDGDEERIALDRPLFSYTTRSAADLLLDHLRCQERIYQGGEIAARFQQEHRQVTVSKSHVLHSDPNRSTAIVAGVDVVDDSFSRVAGRPLDVLPAARRFRFLDLGYESTGRRFVKLNYVDRDLLDEDFNLGGFTSVHVAVSPRISNHSPLTWRGRAAAGFAKVFSSNSFFIAQISASTRAPRNRNSILSFDGRSITRFHTHYPQAFVTRMRLDAGWQLDRDVQFLADGESGLRAYPAFAFAGSRRLIVNAEHRLFLGRELFQLFGPSVAVFADSGQAVNGAFRTMKSDAGAGLRIGIARYDSALIRIDWAYAFNDSPQSRRGGVWSIATGHAF
jgi:hypothetical protein